MAFEDRDRSFEKALARQLRRGEPQETCPDAETLAAYHERTLPSEELDRWKTHIVACARCQEVLTQVECTDHISVGVEEEEDVPVFEIPFLTTEALPKFAQALNVPKKQTSTVVAARSAPVAPKTAEKRAEVFAPTRQPAKSWRWLVPVGAIAAGLLVWVGVYQIKVMHRPVEVAVNHPQATTEPPSAPSSQANTSIAQEDSGRTVQGEGSRADNFAANRNAKTTASPPPRNADELKRSYAAKARHTAPATGAVGAAERERSLDRKELRAEGQMAAAAPSAETPSRNEELPSALMKEENAPKQDRNEEVKVAAAPEAPPPAPLPAPAAATLPAPPVPQPGATVEGKAREKDKAARRAEAPNEALQAAPLVSNARAARFGVQTAGSSSSRTVRAPGGKIVWILGDGGVILRSSDGGTTWVSQSSGVSASLVAGSAPSDTVCWMVGKQGTILLTRDGGEHWQKIAAPTAADLAGVSARDAENAAVWSDLRLPRYVTRDAGKTWEHPDTK